jgi:transcriptional regulator with XRE-family HTH domain
MQKNIILEDAKMSVLNERIKQRRLALNLTLLQIADLLGVKEATVQRYESGDIKNIKHETITQLAEILKCSPAYLMGWENDSLASFPLNDTEKEIVLEYRKADDITKSMVLRVLSIDEQVKGEEEKMA